jgi:hypothetical protein
MKRNPAGNTTTRIEERQDVNLDGHYRQIGISAVLAALPYQDNVKPAADEAVASHDPRWLERMAAA